MAVALALTAAVLAALAFVVSGPSRRWVRGRIPGSVLRPEPAGRGALVLSVGVGLGALTLVDGVLGWGAAGAAGFVSYRWQSKRGSQRDRLARTQRALSMPLALDLMAACLAMGATQHESLAVVSQTVPGSLGRDLCTVAGALRVGADAAEAWSLIDAPDLQAVRSLLTRVDDSGASAAPMLALVAEQLRQHARGEALDAARALGVRLAGPLGLCFLPAFVLIGVIPLVVALLPFRP